MLPQSAEKARKLDLLHWPQSLPVCQWQHLFDGIVGGSSAVPAKQGTSKEYLSDAAHTFHRYFFLGPDSVSASGGVAVEQHRGYRAGFQLRAKHAGGSNHWQISWGTWGGD